MMYTTYKYCIFLLHDYKNIAKNEVFFQKRVKI
jgi:hypothetical protein